MRSIVVANLVTCVAHGAFAQSAAAPAFEVASVKPSKAEEGRFHWTSKNDNLDVPNLPLRTVILAAYEIKDYQLTGPDWLASVRFDIAAKAPSLTKDDEMPARMQALLADRFHLTVRRETKPMAAYALVVAKGGQKIHRVE